MDRLRVGGFWFYGQVIQHFLLTFLNLEEIGRGQPLVIDACMGLASAFQEFPQFLNISLRLVQLRVILDHGVTYSKMMLAKVTADPVLGVNPAGLLFCRSARRLKAFFHEQGLDVVEHQLRVKKERAIDLAEIGASNGKLAGNRKKSNRRQG